MVDVEAVWLGADGVKPGMVCVVGAVEPWKGAGFGCVALFHASSGGFVAEGFVAGSAEEAAAWVVERDPGVMVVGKSHAGHAAFTGWVGAGMTSSDAVSVVRQATREGRLRLEREGVLGEQLGALVAESPAGWRVMPLAILAWIWSHL